MALPSLYAQYGDGDTHPAVFPKLRKRLEQVTEKSQLPSHRSSSYGPPEKILDDVKVGFVLRGVLSPEECKTIVDASESEGYQRAEEYCFMYRNRQNDRFMADDPELASFIWDRTKQFIPAKMKVQGTNWKVEGLNSRFRFCKYNGSKGHYFGAHTDGMYTRDEDHMSLLTCMLYLNGTKDFEGGLTNFIDFNTRSVNYSISPAPGLCAVFPQGSMQYFHEGTRVTSGTKYILRTDVMYCAVH